MTSRSSGPDMITIHDKKTCKQWKGRGNQNQVTRKLYFHPTFQTVKLSFMNSSLKKKSPYLRYYLKASFILLRIVWQNMTYERYENRETMGTKFIN